MPRRILLLVVLIGLCAYSANGQNSLLTNELFVSDANVAIQQAYNREFAASVRTMLSWREEHPENPVWILWPVFEAWWPVIADLTDTRNDEAFISVMRQATSYASRFTENDDYYLDALIVQAIGYAFWGRLQSNRGQWLRSFRNSRRSLNLLQEISRLAPEHPDIPFGEGMTLYFSAFLLDQYPSARAFSFLLPQGDRAKGLEILRIVAQQGVFFRVETMYFLGHIYLHYERQPTEALPFIEQLYAEHPANSYYARLMARTYFRLQRYGEAQSVILSHLARIESPQNLEERALLEEFFFLQGRILQMDGQFAQAIHYFERSKQESKHMFGSGQRHNEVRAHYYQGQVHLSRNEIPEARRQFQWVTRSGADNTYVRLAQTALQQL